MVQAGLFSDIVRMMVVAGDVRDAVTVKDRVGRQHVRCSLISLLTIARNGLLPAGFELDPPSFLLEGIYYIFI